jgi:GAF domain-containing protein
MLYAAPLPSSPRTAGRSPRTEQAIQVVLRLLREQLGMDVVHVGQFSEGERRFRVVEALQHGPAAALATASGQRGAAAGELLEAPITLPDGRVHGTLCCHSPGDDPAQAERHLRLLRHGARLAARLLDQEEVLRELGRQVPSH